MGFEKIELILCDNQTIHNYNKGCFVPYKCILGRDSKTLT